MAFLRIGLDRESECNVIFADRSRHASLLAWLQDGYSGDVEDLIKRGRLVLIGGAPTGEELLANIATELDAVIARGSTLIRFLGFIAWGVDGWPDEASLLEFESKVNAAVMAYPAVIICTYGVPTLSGGQLIGGGLITHPVVFLNDRMLSGNPLHYDPTRKTDTDKRSA